MGRSQKKRLAIASLAMAGVIAVSASSVVMAKAEDPFGPLLKMDTVQQGENPSWMEGVLVDLDGIQGVGADFQVRDREAFAESMEARKMRIEQVNAMLEGDYSADRFAELTNLEMRCMIERGVSTAHDGPAMVPDAQGVVMPVYAFRADPDAGLSQDEASRAALQCQQKYTGVYTFAYQAEHASK